MTYKEWRKTAVACTDLRIIPTIGDNYEYLDPDQKVPGVAFMEWVGEDFHLSRFDLTGYITQSDGLWNVLISNSERQFVDFETAAKYLWKEWVSSEVFDLIDWNKQAVWSTGEELVIIDGPSPDGGMEVRAPIEFVKSTREVTCTIKNDGTIAHPLYNSYPRVVNR